MADDETALTATPSSSSGSARGRASVPTKIGRYEIVKLIGQGGVGAVFEAIDPELGRRVAIKLLRDEAGDTEMLRREAQALAKLVHPNVVTVHDVGVAEGEVFLVMQLVPGVTIDRWLAARKASAEDIVALFRQAGRGLVAAHAAGLVHCDFKPSNVLVDGEGVPRVGDFGLARTTRTTERDAIARASMHMIAGTPAYMAPEQFDGVASAATDQFAFCVALWEVLAGERPYGDSGFDTPRGPRRKLGSRIPPHVARALERGLADDPSARFPSMHALLDALVPPSHAVRNALVVAGALAAIAGGVVAVRALTRRAPWDGADVAGRTALTHFGASACASDPMFDGSTVVFTLTRNDDVDVYAMPLRGGDLRRLTSSPAMEWRPNVGRHAGEVIYLVHDHGGQQARVDALDLATGKASTLIDHRLIWDATAAGDTLLYSPDEPAGLRVLEASGERALADPEVGHGLLTLAVSPDRTTAATIEIDDKDAPGRVCTIPLPRGALTCYPTRATEGRPAFAPSGTAVYYGAADGVHRYDLDHDEDIAVVPTTPVDQGVAVAPDGSALVYSGCRSHTNVIDETDGHIVQLDGNAWHVTAASTGAFAWVRDVDTGKVLVYKDPTGAIHELTDPAFGSIRSPSFDPTGTKIVFAANGAHAGLYYAEVDKSGVIRQITSDPLAVNPVWTRSGEIVFQREDTHGDAHTFAVPVAGGQARPLGAYWVFSVHGDDVLVGDDKLSWLDSRTGAVRPGPDNPDGEPPYAAAVSPNGRWLAIVTTPQYAHVYVLRLDVPGAKPVLVKRYGDGTTSTRVAIDDGGHVISTPQTWSGDLYVIPARDGSHF